MRCVPTGKASPAVLLHRGATIRGAPRHCQRHIHPATAGTSYAADPEIAAMAARLEHDVAAQQALLLALSEGSRNGLAVKATAIAAIGGDPTPEAAKLAVAAMMARAAAADTDGDGVIDRHEFNRWLVDAGEKAAEHAGAVAATVPPTFRQLGCVGLNAAVWHAP